MIRSMTGYGWGKSSNGSRIYKAEIRAVNHKYSDIQVKAPRNYMAIEDKLKAVISGKLHRGKIDLYLSYEDIAVSETAIKVDIPLAKAYYSALKLLGNELELTRADNDIGISLLTRFGDIIKHDNSEEDVDAQWPYISEAVQAAVDMLYKMSVVEGQNLIQNINEKASVIRTVLDEIKARAPEVIEENFSKFVARIIKMTENISIDNNRLIQEAAVLSDRYDINEEISRLGSHLKQLDLIISENESIGKKLDFLVQEMNREINTIGSKANDIELSKRVVAVKNELEKIREQVQNIE